MNIKVILILTAVVCLFMTSCKNTVSESIVGPTDGDGDETTKLVTLNLNEEQVSMSGSVTNRVGNLSLLE